MTAPPIAWIGLLRVALGALFVSVFFENLNKDLYREQGYSGLIEGYIRDGNAPGAWKDFMQFIADGATVFGPLQAVFEAALGALLVVGLGTGLVALAAAGHLTALWVSEWATAWVWELLMLIFVAVAVGLSSLPALRSPGRLRDRLLGPRTFGALGLPVRLALALAGGAGLGLAIFAARTGGENNYEAIAWQSGVAFGILLVVLALLDERKPLPPR